MMEKKLPEGWEWTKLSKICEKPQYGYTTSAKHDGIPPQLLRTTDISKGEINWGSVPFCSEPPIDEGRYLLKEGDILIARAGSVGASIVVRNPPESIFASYLIRFRPKENLNPKYAGFFLRSNMFWAQLGNKTAGTTLPGVNATNLSNVKTPLPPIETQRKIVAILEKADETKKLRTQADGLTSQLLQSVFLEMFGDPMKNPKGWEIKELKEIGFVKTGNTPPRKNPEYYGNCIEWIKSDNINTPYTYLTKSEEMLSEEGAKVGRTAHKNSVLVTCIAGSISCIGNVAIADRDVAFNQQINAIIPKEHINVFFLYYLILSSKIYIQNSSTQAMKGMISKSAFESLRFICPPCHLQDKFGKYAEEVEKLKNHQKQSQQEIDNLFNALMQKAFKGELVA